MANVRFPTLCVGGVPGSGRAGTTPDSAGQQPQSAGCPGGYDSPMLFVGRLLRLQAVGNRDVALMWRSDQGDADAAA